MKTDTSNIRSINDEIFDSEGLKLLELALAEPITYGPHSDKQRLEAGTKVALRKVTIDKGTCKIALDIDPEGQGGTIYISLASFKDKVGILADSTSNLIERS